MNIALLGGQIALVFCLIFVGVLVNKLNFMHVQTSNDLTNILLNIVSPCLILNAFEQPYSNDRVHQFLLSALGVFIFYIISILISHLFFSSVTSVNLKTVSIYGSVYSNAGFMGVPLAAALFGKAGVFFAVVSLTGFNLFNWTHGIWLFSADKDQNDWRQTLKKVFLNANIIAIVIGLVIFFYQIKLPQIPDSVIKYIASINTPLSMIVIGNSLANARLDRHTFNLQLWSSLFLRNFLFPLTAAFILKILSVTGAAFYTTVLMMACPTAGIVVLFTLQAGRNTASAVTLMSLSTILSLFSIPLVFYLISI